MQATYKILEYDEIDISGGIDVDKASAFWFFKDIGLKYEPYLCNGCHDLIQKSVSFNNVAILYVKGNAYRIHFWVYEQRWCHWHNENSNLVDKNRVFYIFFHI